MIDEKKIEEAIPEVFANYCGVSKFIPVSNNFRGGFNEGINWFLDNLWHDASEIPKRDTENITFLVVECNDRSYKRFQIVKLLYDGGYEDIVDMFEVTRWLYLDDLLKGGK